MSPSNPSLGHADEEKSTHQYQASTCFSLISTACTSRHWTHYYGPEEKGEGHAHWHVSLQGPPSGSAGSFLAQIYYCPFTADPVCDSHVTADSENSVPASGSSQGYTCTPGYDDELIGVTSSTTSSTSN
eukprot:1641819-Rhodomonas_salina.1